MIVLDITMIVKYSHVIGRGFCLFIPALLSFYYVNAQSGPGGIGSNIQVKIWLDASMLSGLTNGQKVQTLLDKSGNGMNAVQSNTLNAPTFSTNQLNGCPAVVFNRASAPQLLQITNPGTGSLMSNSNTIFVVSKGTSGGVASTGQGFYQVVFATGAGYVNGIMYTGYPNLAKTSLVQYVNGDGASPAANLTASSNTTQNSWQISTQWSNEQPGLTTFKAYVNGMDLALKTSTAAMADYSNYDVVSIGAYASSGYMCALNGAIAEVIVYNIPLNNAQRTIVDNYLSAKYNITIADDYYFGHEQSYSRDVIGIGTWQAQANNTVTTSNNEKGLVLTEINGSLNTNNEYLMAGHSTVLNAETTNNIPTFINRRWMKDWYIKKTGSIDARMSFDFSDGGISSPIKGQSANNFYLLYRITPTSDFSVVTNGGVPVTATVSNGDRLDFDISNTLLANGYYTIGYGGVITWSGASNTDWSNPLNWDAGRVPDATDLAIINACSVCPELSTSSTIHNLIMNQQSRLNIGHYELTANNSISIVEANLVSMGGKLKAGDFTEIKTSNFMGPMQIEKISGNDNMCYGGNVFSPEVKFINNSTASWNLSYEIHNTIINR